MSSALGWPPGKLIALDLGLARIGVATCDPLGLTTRPLTVIRRKSRRHDFEHLAAIVGREESIAVVCGLPLNMDGSEGDQARMTRKWAMRLAHALRTLLGQPQPIVFWDERLSTFSAGEIMAADDRRSDFGEDAVAAQVILRSYLDALRRGDERDFGEICLPPAPAANAPADAVSD